MSITIETLKGQALADALPSLARLRIAVFRDFPYLYDGSLSYEREYLSVFASSEGSIIVTARDGDEIIGGATAAPLKGHTPEFAELLAARGHDPDKVFYFGESVLLPEYRGRGIGHAFFDWREEHARETPGPKGGYTNTTFCAVVRPDDHPLKPAGYRPLDAFWIKRGYSKIDGLVGSLTWKDLGQTEATEKPMQFWMKAL